MVRQSGEGRSVPSRSAELAESRKAALDKLEAAIAERVELAANPAFGTGEFLELADSLKRLEWLRGYLAESR